jgi:hypothetical protein
MLHAPASHGGIHMGTIRSGAFRQSAAATLAIAAAILSAPAAPQVPAVPVPQEPVPVYVPPPASPEPVLAPTPLGQPAPIVEPLPQAVPASYQPAYPTAMGTAPRTSLRDLFVGTLAVAAQATGTQLVMGLAQAVTGGLASWFSRKTGTSGLAGQNLAATPAIMPPPVALPAQPTPPPMVAPMPVPGDPNVFPTQAAPVALGATPPVQYFDAQTGAVIAQDPVPLAANIPMGDGGGSLFAGLAYEVHAIQADGTATPVNPASHEFRTGDRFIVLYRPTLPGRMEVYNINAAGRRTHIDSAELAGGELARLGPYEFAAGTGDEQLKLILTPCSSPALTLATRDIVNVSGSLPAPTPGAGLSLAGCGGPVTRSADGPATRDIRKVAVEGTTGFALDPVGTDERATGQLAPREVTILFKHR